MATPKVKATYSLDELTVKKLGEIARKWNTSRSEALTRLINAGPEPSAADEIALKLAALRDVQASLSHLTPEEWEKWERDTHELHRSWELPWEKDASDSEK